MIQSLRELWTIWRRRPSILIQQDGPETAFPRVSVTMISRRGSKVISSYGATPHGQAWAAIDAEKLSSITGLPVFDFRKAAEMKE